MARIGVTFVILILLSLCCYCLSQSTNQFIKVDNTTKQFVDSLGRTRIFHGVNSVYKIAPWHPELETFNTKDSLSTEDIKYLKEWGFTVLRLGVMWPGVSTGKGEYNITYLDLMNDLIYRLGESGIYTIVDCHQDLFSRYYCGEGAPDWVMNEEEKTAKFPTPVRDPDTLSYDPNGYPNISSCLETPFFSYYKAGAVQEAFQNLYENVNGLQDEFIKYWQTVANSFKNNPFVLAYELINEPWAGNQYRNPKEYLPGYADKTFIFPMYQNITKAIREIDNEHIIFFEAAISNQLESGFTEGPGGPSYDDRQAYAYHVYCGSTNSNGDPTRPEICNIEDLEIFDVKKRDYERMNLAGFITEFGALQGTPQGVALINNITDKADKNLQSWVYWQYKFNEDLTTQSSTGAESFWINGTLDLPKVKALSRTYAQAIGGVPISQSFDPNTGDYSLNFSVTLPAERVTQIYINTEYYYENGYSIQFSSGLKQLQSEDPFYILFANGEATGDVIISISPYELELSKL